MGYVIDYLEFPSTSSSLSRTFFGKAFGWNFINYGPGYDEIRDAGIGAGINGDAADRSESPLAVIHCDDLVAAEQAVVAAGGTVTRKAYDFPGGRRFHFREPGGAELAVWIAAE